ncbi:FAD-binding oxidoreductase [Ruegeria sp. HKCCA5763]|uniref:NAD(P)/FAD-dependent oxidoreductase n=1 Tax=Ruegeria sp. HKCCA5763 TaxID=2682987 RepID=UPI001487E879|nr:FAD-binding oxidoreductase [Ruegeria sp. HKCCA5763]
MFATPPAMATRPNSLWASTAPSMPDSPQLTGDLHADVSILGAGFTGLRAALALAEAGTSAVVLDAGDVGWGASGRTGGQVNPMLPFNSPKDLQLMLGQTYFERLTEVSLNSADELFSLIDTYQIPCQARQKGWLRVLHNNRALQKAEADVKAWNEFGAGMELLRGDDLRSTSGTAAYSSGVVTPRGGAVQPMMLARGVAGAAQQRGVSIFGNSAVTSMNKVGGKWQLRTDQGSVTSDTVIVATNGYTGPLVPKLPNSIMPLTPIQIATDPLPEDVIASILPQGHTISDSRRIIMYARREPDNRLVYGGLGRMDRAGNLGGFDWLQRDAERVFPQVKGANWSHHWGGRIAVTDDHLPHLHEPQPGLLIGLGYNGRGVAMSHVMGRVLAERALGADSESLTFPTTPVRAMSYRPFKIAGLGTAIWSMRFMDWLETR